MMIFRVPLVIYIILLILSIILLFAIKHHVENIHVILKKNNIEIYEIKNDLQVMEAEFSYLTQPTRIEKLAIKYLHLQPISYKQVKDGINIPKSN